jgi:hypothetical protein
MRWKGGSRTTAAASRWACSSTAWRPSRARSPGSTDRRTDAELEPYAEHQATLTRLPGVHRLGAAAIIAEAGVDTSVFGSTARLAAWADACPGGREGAGRHRDAGARKGNVHLKTAPVTAAACATRVKGSYRKDGYHRLRARRGAMRAAMAIAHKILVAAFHLLPKQAGFRELGETFLGQRAHRRVTQQLLRRLANLGYDVIPRPRQAHPAPA